jgi:hypothetical protein
MRMMPAMKPPSCLVSLRLPSWLVLERSGKMGTCCEIVAARDKKKEGEDMDIDDIRGGGTIRLQEVAGLDLSRTRRGERFI